jgi:hypothetical protein
VKTRFEHMQFPAPAAGRTELRNAISSWERLTTDSTFRDYTSNSAIDAEMQFSDAKRRLSLYFQ